MAEENKQALLEAENEKLKNELTTAQDYIQKLEARLSARSEISGSFAQQLFLKNLGLHNAPNFNQAWAQTEEQLKFLQSKLS